VAKPVKRAALLTEFLTLVENGAIIANDNVIAVSRFSVDFITRSGDYEIASPQRVDVDHCEPGEVLKRMRVAVKAILDGEDPDKALGIERDRGAPRHHRSSADLAVVVHNLRAAKTPWKKILREVNNTRKQAGERELSVPALKKLLSGFAGKIKKFT